MPCLFVKFSWYSHLQGLLSSYSFSSCSLCMPTLPLQLKSIQTVGTTSFFFCCCYADLRQENSLYSIYWNQCSSVENGNSGKKIHTSIWYSEKKTQILPLWHPVSLHVCIALPMPLKIFAYANTPLNAAAGGKKAKVFSLLLTSSSSIPLPAPCSLPDPRHCWDKVLLPPMAERHKPGTTHRKSSGAGVCCRCHL